MIGDGGEFEDQLEDTVSRISEIYRTGRIAVSYRVRTCYCQIETPISDFVHNAMNHCFSTLGVVCVRCVHIF